MAAVAFAHTEGATTSSPSRAAAEALISRYGLPASRVLGAPSPLGRTGGWATASAPASPEARGSLGRSFSSSQPLGFAWRAERDDVLGIDELRRITLGSSAAESVRCEDASAQSFGEYQALGAARQRRRKRQLWTTTSSPNLHGSNAGMFLSSAQDQFEGTWGSEGGTAWPRGLTGDGLQGQGPGDVHGGGGSGGSARVGSDSPLGSATPSWRQDDNDGLGMVPSSAAPSQHKDKKKAHQNPFVEYEDRELRLQRERRWLQEDAAFMELRTKELRHDGVQARLLRKFLFDLRGGSKPLENPPDDEKLRKSRAPLSPPQEIHQQVSKRGMRGEVAVLKTLQKDLRDSINSTGKAYGIGDQMPLASPQHRFRGGLRPNTGSSLPSLG